MQTGEGQGASDAADYLDAGFRTIPEHPDDTAAAGLSEGSASAAVNADGDGGDRVSEQSEHPDDRPKLTGRAADRHAARLHRFLAAGLAPTRAQAAADLLVIRDAVGDDRRMCVECSYYGTRGRCIAAASRRIPGAVSDLQPVPDVLQRCEAFGLRKGLD